MRAKIICQTLEEVKAKFLELCKQQEIDIEGAQAYLPENWNSRLQDYGLVYAVKKDKRVIAVSPYWRTDDHLYELQADLIKSHQLIYSPSSNTKQS